MLNKTPFLAAILASTISNTASATVFEFNGNGRQVVVSSGSGTTLGRNGNPQHKLSALRQETLKKRVIAL